eukprot:CAMPEP_0194172538 /NCGR_PEP_ID=MMETSP0154-20130528/7006_1 /TAXON_ID=1049557 /ORGANISM="Thalassiothrix antarctica, Strain L6-D1" /LENGTH=668 /DNA_ID=CAMNT_0038885263 /DNA_START=95 /DNA_END=2101 /DNA_ORIENTATION=+
MTSTTAMMPSSSFVNNKKEDLDIFLTTLESKLRLPFSSIDMAKAVTQTKGMEPEEYLTNVQKVFHRMDKVTKVRVLIALLGLDPDEDTDTIIYDLYTEAINDNEVGPVDWVRIVAGLNRGIMFRNETENKSKDDDDETEKKSKDGDEDGEIENDSEKDNTSNSNNNTDSNFSCRGEDAQRLLEESCEDILERVFQTEENPDTDPLFSPYMYSLLHSDLLQKTLPECLGNSHFKVNSSAAILQEDEILETTKRESDLNARKKNTAAANKGDGNNNGSNNNNQEGTDASTTNDNNNDSTAKSDDTKSTTKTTDMRDLPTMPGIRKMKSRLRGTMAAAMAASRGGRGLGRGGRLSRGRGAKAGRGAVGAGAAVGNIFAPTKRIMGRGGRSGSGIRSKAQTTMLRRKGGTAKALLSMNIAAPAGEAIVRGKAVGGGRMKVVDSSEVPNLGGTAKTGRKKRSMLLQKQQPRQGGENNKRTKVMPYNNRHVGKPSAAVLMARRGEDDSKFGNFDDDDDDDEEDNKDNNKDDTKKDSVQNDNANNTTAAAPAPAAPSSMQDDDNDDSKFGIFGDEDDDDDDDDDDNEAPPPPPTTTDWKQHLVKANRLSEEDRERVRQFFVDRVNPTPAVPVVRLKLHEEKTMEESTGLTIKETLYLELDYTTYGFKKLRKTKKK